MKRFRSKYTPKTKRFILKKKQRDTAIMSKNKARRILNTVTLTLTKTNTFINLSAVSQSLIGSNPKTQIRCTEKTTSKTLTYISGGMCGFKGKKKSSPMANATIGEMAAIKIKNFGIRHMHLILYAKGGKGKRKYEILRAFNDYGLAIDRIEQKSPISHNGSRSKKLRRKKKKKKKKK